ncbi:MAG: HAD family hydrolase [Bacteroidales bacterium]|nr:HAD family hydrolase [Bacteroidales bacterium]
MKKKTIVVFDFDGTITTKDTLPEFIRFSKGNLRAAFAILFIFPVLIALKLKLIPNWKAKQILFTHLYKGISLARFDEWGKNFTGKIDTMVRPAAIETIRKYQQQNATIAIVSASPQNWIKPWAQSIGIKNILATQLEVDKNGKLTGKFRTKNCYGQEKVNRILQAFPQRGEYTLIAYGDSKGDKEMIRFADKGDYNCFK